MNRPYENVFLDSPKRNGVSLYMVLLTIIQTIKSA